MICKKLLIFISTLLFFSFPSFATDLTIDDEYADEWMDNLVSMVELTDKQSLPLNGAWVRVADGCDDLPNEIVKKLPTSGGGNGMARRMVFTIDGKKFSARSGPSLRCRADFKKDGHIIDDTNDLSKSIICSEESTNTGDIKLYKSQMYLSASKIQGMNPWGRDNEVWDYQLKYDVLKIVAYYRGCTDGNFRMYFIRAITS